MPDSYDVHVLTARPANGSGEPRRLVMRVEPDRPQILPDHDLEREYRVLDRLSSTPIPIPTARWLEGTGDVIGHRFMVMDHVDGDILDELAAPAPTEEPGLLPHRYDSLIDAAGAVHTLDHEELGLAQVLAHTDDTNIAVIDFGAAQRSRAGADDPSLHALEAALRSSCPRAAPASLIHGDLRLGNAIFDREGVAAIIDWEFAAIGDPRRDLAFLEIMASSATFIRPDASIDIDAFASQWERRTGRDADDMQWFRALELYRSACNLCVQRWLYQTGQLIDDRIPDLVAGLDLITHAGLDAVSMSS